MRRFGILVGHYPTTKGAGGLKSPTPPLRWENDWSWALGAAIKAASYHAGVDIRLFWMPLNDYSWPDNFDQVVPAINAADIEGLISLHANGGPGAPADLHLAMHPVGRQRSARLGAALVHGLSELTGWRIKVKGQDRAWGGKGIDIDTGRKMPNGTPIYEPGGRPYRLWDVNHPVVILETHNITVRDDHEVMLELLRSGELAERFIEVLLEVNFG